MEKKKRGLSKSPRFFPRIFIFHGSGKYLKKGSKSQIEWHIKTGEPTRVGSPKKSLIKIILYCKKQNKILIYLQTLKPARQRGFMLILTEKPEVSKAFAKALFCNWDGNCYKSKEHIIINCVGHIYKLEEPNRYGSALPIIPESFLYSVKDDRELKKLAKFVNCMLKENSREKILIATDADREGEIIARECLSQAGITNYSNCFRFWVSEALTPEVVIKGIHNAKPLEAYNNLAAQGFARQHADWLVGMNFSRLLSKKDKYVVGRVQTAILSAIDTRTKRIESFKPVKYFVHTAIFRPTRVGPTTEKEIKGIYFQDEDDEVINEFQESLHNELSQLEGKLGILVSRQNEKQTTAAPGLYNLNDIQKEAFKVYGYSPDYTLKILQGLYDREKCISYPRTPSKVMGTGNVDLCAKIYRELASDKPEYLKIADITVKNKKIFDDKKLESHHAIIPLSRLPRTCNEEQGKIYNMILTRFLTAFLPPEEYLKQTYIISVENNKFKITGRKTIDSGWKKFIPKVKKEEEEQQLDNIDWDNLPLVKIETKENWTKAPEYFNEGSMINFMENPKDENSEILKKVKFHSLGTPATRHTFIPRLVKLGYIQKLGKNILPTKKGRDLLQTVKSSPCKSLTNINETTCWEDELSSNPEVFELKIKQFVKKCCETALSEIVVSCPICKKEIKESDKNFYCTGYKEGCKFNSIWKNAFGTTFTEEDIKVLCSGEKTKEKNCINKGGTKYKASFYLDKEKGFILTPIFSPKEK